MVEMSDIVSKLVERTEQDMVPWKATADDATFAASFGNLSVLISSYGGATRLSVHNEKGTEIDRSESPPYRILDRLHGLAKRQALGTDEKLAELMEALNTPPPP